jgi:hypothetical protein
MKKLNVLLLLLAISFMASAQKSPRKQAEGNVDGIKVAIDYSAPSVKGRKVWGGMEDYGKVWRAGADNNTTVSFDKEVKIGGKTVPAGKYGFFIIPNETGNWVVIFNKRNADWGAYDYDQKQDVVRLEIAPKFVSENQEALDYSVSAKSVDFAWEKARLSIPISK